MKTVRNVLNHEFFYGLLKLMLQGPGTFKSTLDPKTVRYSPRKQLELAEIASFLQFYECRVTESRNV